MKIRYGFVSNSSSQSFIVNKAKLTSEQVDAIYQHIDYAKKVLDWEIDEYDYGWHIEERKISKEDYKKTKMVIENLEEELGFDTDNKPLNEGEYICGHVSMNNFDMGMFFDYIGVSDDAYEFS